MKKAKVSERRACQVLSISRSHLRVEVSARAASDSSLLAAIRGIFEASNGRYGAPRVHDELTERGVRTSRKRVSRLMREGGIVARKHRKFIPTTDSSHDLPVAPNLLERNFAPQARDRAWAGDITYLRTGQHWSYLAVVLDLFSRRIIGWTLSRSLATEGALDAFQAAMRERRPSAGLVVHHDRGCQYASLAYRKAIERRGAILSMSRKANCWDNSPSESFFATLKKELGSTFISFEAGQFALKKYIDWYNTTRRHSFNSGMSPIKKELAAYTCIAA